MARIREETDYEDDRTGGTDNYVRRASLGSGIGEATLAYLLSHGLIESGTNRFFGEIGYRITESGRAALKEDPKPKRLQRRIQPLPSRLGAPKSRIE